MTKIKVSYSKIDYKEVEIQFPLYLYFQILKDLDLFDKKLIK